MNKIYRHHSALQKFKTRHQNHMSSERVDCNCYLHTLMTLYQLQRPTSFGLKCQLAYFDYQHFDNIAIDFRIPSRILYSALSVVHD